jgi:hypothetical protein
LSEASPLTPVSALRWCERIPAMRVKVLAEIATEAATTYGAMLDAAKAERASVRAAREHRLEARSTLDAPKDAPRMRPKDHEKILAALLVRRTARSVVVRPKGFEPLTF